jgi:hypothetical protein
MQRERHGHEGHEDCEGVVPSGATVLQYEILAWSKSVNP